MGEETWRIIYTEEAGTTGAPAGASTQTTEVAKKQSEANEEIKKSAPHWASAGKFAAGLLSIVGVIAFVFQMIRRSKVFSTFMDSFLMILSSVVDILMIPLIPLFAPVLKLLLKSIPLAMEWSKALSDFLKDPWSGAKKLFALIPDAIKWLGEHIGAFFANLGLGGLGGIFKDIGGKLGGAFEKIAPIFNDAVDKIKAIWSNSGLNFWQKIGETATVIWNFIGSSGKIMWEAIKSIWKDDIFPVIKATYEWVKKIWSDDIAPVIKDWWNTTAKDWLTSVVGPAWTSVIRDILGGNFVKAATDAWNIISDWISKRWDEFYKDHLIPKWEAFTAKGGPLDIAWNRFINEIIAPFFTKTLPSLIVEALKGVVKLMGDVLKTLGKTIYENLPTTKLGEKIGESLYKAEENVGYPQLGQYQLGTPYVPKTGSYILHRGEAVTSASMNRTTNQYNKPVNISNVFNITGGMEDILNTLKAKVDESLKQSQMRGYI